MKILAYLIVHILWASAAFSTSLQIASPVQLLPHQQSVVDYMKEHPAQKGLLLAHAMGSGKTFAALALANALLEKDVYMIVPAKLSKTWRNAMAQFGLGKNNAFYNVLSLDEAPFVMKGKDLSRSIVIVDEAHRLVERVRSLEADVSKRYGALYLNILEAKHVFALTGTPIYQDEADIAYLLNLVAGEEILPFNNEEFRVQYTSISRTRSVFRGYFSESMILQIGLPIVGGIMATGLTGNIIAPLITGVVLSLYPSIVNQIVFRIPGYNLRHFNARKIRRFVSEYVSYYGVDSFDPADFPRKTVQEKSVWYSSEQLDFLFNFVENNLGKEELKRILPTSMQKMSDVFVGLNSTTLQRQLSEISGAGREIGNMAFVDPQGQLIESPKFMQILEILQKQEGKSVFYSNYDQNGLDAFAEFLKRHGYEGKFAIVDAGLKLEEQHQLIEDYNAGKTQILLLSSEFTEGISLKNTKAFHVLEPILSAAILDQVVARAIRYRSHSDLRENERHVDVYLWKSEMSIWDYKTWKAKQDNFMKRHAEMDQWANWNWGQQQVNPNYLRERFSPDTFAVIQQKELRESMGDLEEVFRKYAIAN